MRQLTPAPVKFLLVDDLEDNLLVLEALLTRPDVELLKAQSGRHALELLLIHDFALAFIDVQMPEMDGFELAELMRGAERTRRVPIIFVTAGVREQERIFQGYDAGAVDFLFKPVDALILRHKAETFFQLHRQRQELSRQFELLRESEEFRTRMIEGSNDAILVLDCGGRLVSLMGASSKLIAEASWPALRNAEWHAFWGDAERGSVEGACERARQGEVGRFLAQSRFPSSENSWWDVSVTPIRDADGDVERLLAVARDVSQEHEAELERQRLTRELSDTLRFNETFVAAVGHDLRNPLNAILMASELLVRRTQDTAILKVVQRVMTSGRRIASMVDDLSDMARARLSGGIRIQRATTDLVTVARKVMTEHQATHPEREIQLQSEGDFVGGWDSARLEQVLSNLLGNALRHGDPQSAVQIILDGRPSDRVLARVHNEGHIAAELLPHIFEPFRAGRHDHTRSEGLGLGLYIVRQILLAHAGSISVQSTSEAGTTFEIELPRAAPSLPGLAGAPTSSVTAEHVG